MTTYLAPAKINLFLHVVGRRIDGYHELNTFFQFLDLMDTVDIRVNASGVIERVSGPDSIAADDDLVIAAARALRDHAGDHRLGAQIGVTKNIPVGAGLGGGSSDAATTLLGLNEGWQLSLGRQQLAEIGLTLGADVPVFVHGHAGWASGVGEKISRQPAPTRTCVLVTPPVHVSTAEIFGLLSAIPEREPLLLPQALAGGAHETVVDMPSGNDLEAIVRARFVEVDQCMDWLAQYGQPTMSGSGGSVFLAVENRSEADAILAQLPSWWTSDWFSRIVQTLNHHPLNALRNPANID